LPRDEFSFFSVTLPTKSARVILHNPWKHLYQTRKWMVATVKVFAKPFTLSPRERSLTIQGTQQHVPFSLKIGSASESKILAGHGNVARMIAEIGSMPF
jgi:hypothetical protein